MKLSAWAKENGLSYQAAWKMFRAGTLPVPATQIPTGTILVHPPRAASDLCAVYARVSASDQKADLDRQVARLCIHATQAGLKPGTIVTEIGSGMNASRPKLLKLLRDPAIGVIVIEHRDRLARFGFEQIEAALAASGRRLVVAETGEIPSDLVRDMTEVLTSFCARLYGARSARNRAQRAMGEAARDA